MLVFFGVCFVAEQLLILRYAAARARLVVLLLHIVTHDAALLAFKRACTYYAARYAAISMLSSSREACRKHAPHMSHTDGRTES